MDNMYEHIAALCKSKGVSVTQMCRDLGITRSALTELKAGRTQRLSIKYTKMILEYFDIDMTVFERPVEEIGLLNENNNEKSPSEVDELLSKPDITELLELYRALTPGEQRKALSVLKALKETE
jgi:transcriptional regulator with XRE-family HTH domain